MKKLIASEKNYSHATFKRHLIFAVIIRIIFRIIIIYLFI